MPDAVTDCLIAEQPWVRIVDVSNQHNHTFRLFVLSRKAGRLAMGAPACDDLVS